MSARSLAEEAFAAERLESETWMNEAGYRYPEHTHPYHKVLYCISGSIIFHMPSGDVNLSPGDRLDLPPGTPHSASVGPAGVVCMEGHRN